MIELRSPPDDLEELKAKMREYVEAGAQLGWLLDPATRTIYPENGGRVAWGGEVQAAGRSVTV